MTESPPLSGLRVLELAGLAPGPFTGMLLADFGATVLRVDRAQPAAHSIKPPPPTPDFLSRRKSSIAVNLKSIQGLELVKTLIKSVDVIIDPYRPGVLEKSGLGPDVLLKINPRLIIARMTGFRRDGRYKDMAGHDINYIAVSGVLSMLGRKDERPYAPGNIVGDFAGGGGVCFMGILLALLSRERTGQGQVVEANMVDGSSYMATFLRLARSTPMWNDARGTNVLDGGCPYYDTYETKDGKFMAVGALEPHFFKALLERLEIDLTQLSGKREDKSTWPHLRELLTAKFKQKTRAEWESIFANSDACCTPVLDHAELEDSSFDQRPIVTLRKSPGLAISKTPTVGDASVNGQGAGVDGNGWRTMGLRPGVGGEQLLASWLGWRRDQHYHAENGGLEVAGAVHKAKL